MINLDISNLAEFPDKRIQYINLNVYCYYCALFIVSRGTKCTRFRFHFFFFYIYIMDTTEQVKYIFRSFKNVFILFFFILQL
jgi:hypothetical protein